VAGYEDDFDAATEWTRLANLSGRYDVLAEVEQKRREAGDRIVEAAQNNKVSGFRNDAGWEDSGDFFQADGGCDVEAYDDDDW
jgi:hypothetical protein